MLLGVFHGLIRPGLLCLSALHRAAAAAAVVGSLSRAMLFKAIKDGDVAAVEAALQDADTDVNAVNKKGETALLAAIVAGASARTR
jgi:hypothetical protein